MGRLALLQANYFGSCGRPDIGGDPITVGRGWGGFGLGRGASLSAGRRDWICASVCDKQL